MINQPLKNSNKPQSQNEFEICKIIKSGAELKNRKRSFTAEIRTKQG